MRNSYENGFVPSARVASCRRREWLRAAGSFPGAGISSVSPGWGLPAGPLAWLTISGVEPSLDRLPGTAERSAGRVSLPLHDPGNEARLITLLAVGSWDFAGPGFASAGWSGEKFGGKGGAT